MPKSLRLRPLLLGIAFCTLLSGLVLGFQQPERHSRVMRDGSTVTFEGVTFGPGEHRFAVGNRFERWLGSTLSRSAARRLGLRVGVSAPPETPHGEGDHLVAWFTLKPPSVYGFTSWGGIIHDGKGRVAWTDANPEVKAGAIPIPIRVRSFPRRGSTVRLRLHHRFNPNGRPDIVTEADFDLPNPASRSFPEWQPAPLPVTRLTEDLEVTLLHLATGKVPWGPPKSPDMRESRIGVRVRPLGKRASAWRIGEIVVSDTTNNRYSFGWLRAPYLPRRDGVTWLALTGEFPMEPVWKVSVRLVRERDTPLRAEFKDVPLPIQGKSRRLNWRRPIHGGTLVLEKVYLDESWYTDLPVGDRLPAPARGYGYRFRGEGLPGQEEICVARLDGGALEEHIRFALWDGGATFTVPAAARTVDLSVERSFHSPPAGESRTVEFIVRPEPL